MKKYKLTLIVAVFLILFVTLLVWLTHGHTVALLQPKGTIGMQQRNLLYFALTLSMIVIIPVYILTIFIATKYRADNHKAKYDPEWDHNRKLEAVWWGIPFAIILILSIVTWNSSHALDPFKSLKSSTKPMTIQVVALQWKWLFIYPEQHIATVNYVRFPVNTPIDFEITADAPMNSFWIPQLGGQVYAMPGMSTHLHLMASQAGSYDGSSANISGKGFSGMTFKALATDRQNFDTWAAATHKLPAGLDTVAYARLAQPSSNVPVNEYGKVDAGLYDTIVMKYMTPDASTTGTNVEGTKK